MEVYVYVGEGAGEPTCTSGTTYSRGKALVAKTEFVGEEKL